MSPQFIGLFEILDRVRKVAYRLALPPKMSGVHNVFHVNMLTKYIRDPSHVVDYNDIEVNENMTYKERFVRILDRKSTRLNSSH